MLTAETDCGPRGAAALGADAEAVCLSLNEACEIPGLTRAPRRTPGAGSRVSWRIPPYPLRLPDSTLDLIRRLGPALAKFMRAANRLYLEAGAFGAGWVQDLLDRGKPPAIVAAGRAAAFRDQVPFVIRPDLLPVEDGLMLTELDSVPGGIGLTAHMNELYEDRGFRVVGGARGMLDGFHAGAGLAPARRAALVVSEESADYLPEMEWLAGRLTANGAVVSAVKPEDPGVADAEVLYRFFELFDLDQVPGSRRMLAQAEAGHVHLTPPPKPFLEEKLWLALFWDARLESYWKNALGAETVSLLRGVIPETWVVDPASPVPESAGLTARGARVRTWADLAGATQKERHLVLKISGFSPLAWGGRGVTIGHDLPARAWRDALDTALASFSSNPYILQRFGRGRRCAVAYYDFSSKRIVRMDGRARLCPYYFETGPSELSLGGILATVCPLDKKLIHGMVDAVMGPISA